MLLPWPKGELMWDNQFEFVGSPVSKNEQRYLDRTRYNQI